MLNRNFKDFKFRHQRNENQILYTSYKTNNGSEILNLINNFLNEKNSFIFESVEKVKIRGRYTIFGKNPDKIWEFNNKNSYLIKNKIKKKIKGNPAKIIENIIEDFKFKTPAGLPSICSLISGYFSYDTIRYIEKVPNNCKNDLNGLFRWQREAQSATPSWDGHATMLGNCKAAKSVGLNKHRTHEEGSNALKNLF